MDEWKKLKSPSFFFPFKWLNFHSIPFHFVRFKKVASMPVFSSLLKTPFPFLTSYLLPPYLQSCPSPTPTPTPTPNHALTSLFFYFIFFFCGIHFFWGGGREGFGSSLPPLFLTHISAQPSTLYQNQSLESLADVANPYFTAAPGGGWGLKERKIEIILT